MTSITPRRKSAAGSTGSEADRSSAGCQEVHGFPSHGILRLDMVPAGWIGVRWTLTREPTGELVAASTTKRWALTRRAAMRQGWKAVKRQTRGPSRLMIYWHDLGLVFAESEGNVIGPSSDSRD